ncbi:MAG: ThiF family adenylyltransferase [Chloroflexota bacterium]|nr:ThiF family adenylyltransferase [Chloroflexota bacterium]
MTTATNWDRVERLIGASNLARLAQKRVGVIGVGSGGGFVALTLAMSGVGQFVLVDDDVVEATNIVRHVADGRYLGQPKVEAVADLIRQRNPAASVVTHNGRIEDNIDALDGLDLLIVGVDGENAKYRINEACLARGIVAVYAGVYARGEGGDVTVIRPDDAESPCYACWAAVVRESAADATRKDGEFDDLDYGMIGVDGTLDAEPGLYLHVVRVAAAQADMALNELLATTTNHRLMPGNTVILANSALEILSGSITPPYGAVWVTVERDPDCMVCGGRNLAADAAALSLDDLIAAGYAVDEQDELKQGEDEP